MDDIKQRQAIREVVGILPPPGTFERYDVFVEGEDVDRETLQLRNPALPADAALGRGWTTRTIPARPRMTLGQWLVVDGQIGFLAEANSPEGLQLQPVVFRYVKEGQTMQGVLTLLPAQKS